MQGGGGNLHKEQGVEDLYCKYRTLDVSSASPIFSNRANILAEGYRFGDGPNFRLQVQLASFSVSEGESNTPETSKYFAKYIFLSQNPE